MTSPDRVVLVVGSPLAGVDGVASALRGRVPDIRVVDACEPGRVPDAVVAVVSAVAPLTRSQWARVEDAATGTDRVVAAVSKIDAHRRWRDVMAADRERVRQWDGREIPWVGVAAAPDLGDPSIGELVGVLRERLGRPGRVRRPDPDAIESRRARQRTRLRLLRIVRDRTAAMRTELHLAAAVVPAGGAATFEREVLTRAEQFERELDDEIARQLPGQLPIRPRRVGHVDLGRPASSSRRLEARLTTVLGIGFGLGVAVASGRLLAGLAPGLSLAGAVTGAVAAVGLVVWVVRARRLLQERALLDRWVVEVAATLRWRAEATVAERLLECETGWATARLRPPAVSAKDVTDQYEW